MPLRNFNAYLMSKLILFSPPLIFIIIISNPEYLLEGLMLKLQYFGYLMRRANSLEKTLTLGKIKGKRRRGAAEDEMVR